MPLDSEVICDKSCLHIERREMHRFKPDDIIDHSLGGRTVNYTGWWCLVKKQEVYPDKQQPCGVTAEDTERYVADLERKLSNLRPKQ